MLVRVQPSELYLGTLTKETAVAKKEQKQQERKIKIVKMVSGNTVIADSLYVNSKYELIKPLEVVIMPDPSGSNRTVISLMDFIPGGISEKVAVTKEHVLCTSDPDERVVKLYKQATEPQSPIAQPAEKKLLGV